jgi:hypothetical protein
MPRQNRRRTDDPARSTQPRSVVGERVESWRGEDYLVRSLAGTRSGQPYRCPGCDQLVAASAPHVVVWPADDPDATDRRHWHTTCWSARDRRAPTIQRGRASPRY